MSPTAKTIDFEYFALKRKYRWGWRLATISLILLISMAKFVANYILSEFYNSQTAVTNDNLEVSKRSSMRHLLSTDVFNCSPQAIQNFPNDLFTDLERRHGVVVIHVMVTLYMFLGIALVCDEYFCPCLECICNALKLTPDVAGATFMAAGSSAPELATTMIGVFVAKDDIGLGAVVGSADYNIMFVISVCALFAKTVIYLNWWPLVRDCSVYSLCIVLLAVVIYDNKVYWYEALIFVFGYGFYILLMRFNTRIDNYLTALCDRQPATCCSRVRHNSGLLDDEESVGGVDRHELEVVQGTRGQTLYSPVSDAVKLSTNGDGQLHDGDVIFLAANGTNSDDSCFVNVKPNSLTRVSSNESVGELRLPSYDTHMDPSSSATNNSCLHTLAWPEESGLCLRTIHVLSFPIKLTLALTVPDCRVARWRSWFWITFLMSCFWISFYSYVMIWMITIIGHTARIPDTVMGLTFIAAGSSVPDAIASVIVVREGQGDMAVSNAVGSNIFDILLCMGIPWLLKTAINQEPVKIYSRGLVYATVTLLSTVVILLAATHANRWRLTKPYGVLLMFVYMAYLILCSLYELNVFGQVHPEACPYLD